MTRLHATAGSWLQTMHGSVNHTKMYNVLALEGGRCEPDGGLRTKALASAGCGNRREFPPTLALLLTTTTCCLSISKSSPIYDLTLLRLDLDRSIGKFLSLLTLLSSPAPPLTCKPFNVREIASVPCCFCCRLACCLHIGVQRVEILGLKKRILSKGFWTKLTCEQSTLNHQSQMKYCWLKRVPLGQRKLYLGRKSWSWDE